MADIGYDVIFDASYWYLMPNWSIHIQIQKNAFRACKPPETCHLWQCY